MRTVSQPELFPRFSTLLNSPAGSLLALRGASLSQLDAFFAPFLPPHLLSPADDGPNSRERIYSLRRTFWAFLSQTLKPHTSCNEVALQVVALAGLSDPGKLKAHSSTYCTARQRLPRECADRAFRECARAADQRAGTHGHLAGRPVRVVDASSVQLPDTALNQKRFPQPKPQKPGCGFPVMKLGALFSLSSGALSAVEFRGLDWSDLRLFRALWEHLRPGDIVLGDRAFGDFVSLAMLPGRGVDLVARLHQRRMPDFRTAQRRLGPGDAVFRWTKPWVRPPHLSQEDFDALAKTLDVRVIRVRIDEPGFRTRLVYLATTLLDAEKYPAAELAALYRRRWRLELCFRDLKTTMKMEMLRCQSPAMAEKECLFFLIAYNLMRVLMAEAASRHGARLERLSFKSAIDALRQFSLARAQARNAKQRRDAEAELLRVVASGTVPERPGRREPRAVKRRPKPFALLTQPRHKYREIPHRNRYTLDTAGKAPRNSKA